MSQIFKRPFRKPISFDEFTFQILLNLCFRCYYFHILTLFFLNILGKFPFDKQIAYILSFDKVQYYYTGLNFHAILRVFRVFKEKF
jgi:hypothetical protein